MKSCSLTLEFAGSDGFCVCNTLPMASTDMSISPLQSGGCAPYFAPVDDDAIDRETFLVCMSLHDLDHGRDVSLRQPVIPQPNGAHSLAVARQAEQALRPGVIGGHYRAKRARQRFDEIFGIARSVAVYCTRWCVGRFHGDDRVY